MGPDRAQIESGLRLDAGSALGLGCVPIWGQGQPVHYWGKEGTSEAELPVS